MWIPFVFEAVAIITGNVTVLVVFTRTPSLRKRKHYLLVNLAVADLLVGLVSLPMYVTLISVPTTSTFDRIYQTQDIFFGTASVFGVTAVAIERVYAVYFPFKHRTLGKGSYIIGITVVWLMAALLATSKIYAEQPTFYPTVAFMLISFFIVMFSYTSIWIKMNCVTNIQNHAIPRRDKKFTLTLFIVTVISLIAWIPFLVVNLLGLLCYYRCFGFADFATMLRVTKFCHYGNSFVNPIIYALRMPQFRNSLLYPLQCSVCQRNNEIYGNGIRKHDNLRNYDNNSSDHENDGSDHGNNDSDHGNNDSDHGNNGSDHGNVVEISKNILRETSV